MDKTYTAFTDQILQYLSSPWYDTLSGMKWVNMLHNQVYNVGDHEQTPSPLPAVHVDTIIACSKYPGSISFHDWRSKLINKSASRSDRIMGVDYIQYQQFRLLSATRWQLGRVKMCDVCIPDNVTENLALFNRIYHAVRLRSYNLLQQCTCCTNP